MSFVAKRTPGSAPYLICQESLFFIMFPSLTASSGGVEDFGLTLVMFCLLDPCEW